MIHTIIIVIIIISTMIHILIIGQRSSSRRVQNCGLSERPCWNAGNAALANPATSLSWVTCTSFWCLLYLTICCQVTCKKQWGQPGNMSMLHSGNMILLLKRATNVPWVMCTMQRSFLRFTDPPFPCGIRGQWVDMATFCILSHLYQMERSFLRATDPPIICDIWGQFDNPATRVSQGTYNYVQSNSNLQQNKIPTKPIRTFI